MSGQTLSGSLVTQLFAQQYTLDLLQDEVRQLVETGRVSRQQPIYALCHHIAAREWPNIERLLEAHSYLLRDRIIDLLSSETWLED
jgi:Domain of unknown function (DUF4327)